VALPQEPEIDILHPRDDSGGDHAAGQKGAHVLPHEGRLDEVEVAEHHDRDV